VSAPEPRWRRLEPDERRRQILGCARRLFGEQHYEAVSTTELARQSGVARGLINHYFGSKRGLYLEVLRELVFIPEFAVEQLAHGTLAERAAASIDRMLDVIDRNRNVWLATLDTGGYGDSDVAEILREADDVAADRMLETVGLGDLGAGREELRAMIRAYSAMARAATREWLVTGALTRQQVHGLLATTLATVIDHAQPGVFAAKRLSS
jgi:AcrR family transcriptional regulator